MNREEYFKKSQKMSLPNRCPIMGKCGRYYVTLYLSRELNEYGKGENWIERLRNAGFLRNEFEKNGIEVQGEEPWTQKGSGSASFGNICPEVPLFDDEHGLIPNLETQAYVKADWDECYKNPRIKGAEHRHYSECPEFSKYIFDNKLKVKALEPVFVYLMRNNQNGFYKIGKSNKPKFRERTLQSQEPDVELIEKWETDASEEKFLHRKFSEKRLRGEWFSLEKADIQFITEYMNKKTK